MTIFSPVWISSTEHLAAFKNLIKNTSRWRKSFNLYKIPESFPYAVSWWLDFYIGIFRSPLGFFASGDLGVEDNEVTFVSKPYKTFGWQYRNFRSDLTFQFGRQEIKSIERLESNNLVWAKVITSKDILDGHLLMTIGGPGAYDQSSKKRTDELIRTLMSLKENSA